MQILAGNARKVGAVRFERVTAHDEGSDSSSSLLELERNSDTKEMKKVVPKIMKRKFGGDVSDDETCRSEEGDVIPQHQLKQGE